MVKLEIRPDEIGHHVDDASVKGHVSVNRIDLRRVVHAPQHRSVGAVAATEIEARTPVDGFAEAFAVFAAVVDPAAKRCPHLLELLRSDRVFGHRVAVAPEVPDLGLAQPAGARGVHGFGLSSASRMRDRRLCCW